MAYLETPEEPNFTVIVEDIPFHLHRRVLSEKSTFFAAMFRVRPDYVSIDLTNGAATTRSGGVEFSEGATFPLRSEDFQAFVDLWYGEEQVYPGLPTILEYPAVKYNIDRIAEFFGSEAPIVACDINPEFDIFQVFVGPRTGIFRFLFENGDFEDYTRPLKAERSRFSLAGEGIDRINARIDLIVGQAIPYRLTQIDVEKSDPSFSVELTMKDPRGKYPPFSLDLEDIDNDGIFVDMTDFLNDAVLTAAEKTFAYQVEDEE